MAGTFTVEDPAGGIVTGNAISWTISSLAPNASRVIRYRVRVSPSMMHGQVISNTASLASAGLSGLRSDTETVRVITALPQTGLGGFLSPLNGTSQFISPHQRVQADADETSSLPILIWLNIIAIGLSGGLLAGKRLFVL